MQEIQRLEGELEALKAKYEQYFLGNERLEPADDRRRLSRKIHDIAESPDNNTAARFRAQQLKSRLTTYGMYWNRILRQIENGTYQRHQFRVKMRSQLESELGGGSPANKSAASAGEGFDDVIRQYQSIQQESGQKPVNAEKLASVLRKQEAQLKQKFQSKSVQFRVVVEDGKPKLKAKPVK